MRALSQADCLALWESGRSLHPVDRGLLAVHTAFPEARSESVADWPLGRRNRALAELRCACFGPWIRGWAACRKCGDKLEFEVNGRDLAESRGESPAEERVRFHGLEFRVPTSRDLARITGERDAAAALARLLAECEVSGSETGPADWTEAELEALGEQMAQADPLAEILLDFACPVCGESFQEPLDLTEFLWSEIEGRAKRLLLEVHTLARSYGWGEAEILSLSAARREFYLGMATA